MKHILIIGTVWPEPNSSAAGSRMLQIISFFVKKKYSITFATTAKESAHSFPLKTIGVSTQKIELNSSNFDDFIKDLNPEIVIFDRFMIEEQFGWRVAEICPHAIRILDTEDLHCLRKTRELAIKKEQKFDTKILLNNETAKRELASIYRCDLSLIISTHEMNILQNIFNVDDSILFYLPFLLDNKQKPNTPPFEEREHFVTIGNFLHSPNWDAVLYLKKVIWPHIRKQLPKAQMHVYGAYSSDKVSQLHNERDGFNILGRAKNVVDVMSNARVCLAPLRFGAGLKGKLIDAMKNGTPNITTSIGAEGMKSINENWSGFIEDDAIKFSEKAVKLYTDKLVWDTAQKQGFELLNNFSASHFESQFIKRIETLENDLTPHRSNNFIGAMLRHHTMQSTKFMSKWIEVKNMK